MHSNDSIHLRMVQPADFILVHLTHITHPNTQYTYCRNFIIYEQIPYLYIHGATTK